VFTNFCVAVFRKLRQGRAQQTLFNLSLALLLAMLVFLIGIRQTHSHGLCIAVAVLLHYLVLVSFMWMLVEAVLQYLTFVKILGTYITRYTLKTVLPAWGESTGTHAFTDIHRHAYITNMQILYIYKTQDAVLHYW